MWGTIASDTLIPDYFPPETPVLRSIFVNPFSPIDIGFCERRFEPVHLGQYCIEHDLCYSTIGEEKDSCDLNLLDGWKKSCGERYGQEKSLAGLICGSLCKFSVKFMYRAMRYDDGLFCPSCEAFDRSQEKDRDGGEQ